MQEKIKTGAGEIIPLKMWNIKILGTTLTDQNSVLEEIKSRLQSGNACCHSVQNL
jgi:hypothetical protein